MTSAEKRSYQRQAILHDMEKQNLKPPEYSKAYNLGFRKKVDGVGKLSVPTLYRRQKNYNEDSIEEFWGLASRSKTERLLRVMIKQICGVDHPNFLTKASATKVISALREIAEKAGFNPDRETKESHGRL